MRAKTAVDKTRTFTPLRVPEPVEDVLSLHEGAIDAWGVMATGAQVSELRLRSSS